jgi:glycosyltransferase involved in cell wall biosynthesis
MSQSPEITNRPLKVAALTGGVNTPSSRFRIRQYASRLKTLGVTIEEHIPFFEKSCGLPSPFKAAARIPGIIRSRKADVVWVGKELVKGYPGFERMLKHPRILDADDAIWLSMPFGKFAGPGIGKAMDAVIAGNSYLADYFSKYCSNVYIVPTAIDLDRYQLRPAIKENEPEKFVLGWTGLRCNYKYLKQIEPALLKFMKNHERAELMLVANSPWEKHNLPPEKIKFVPWSMQNEATALHEMSVGLMPLTDDKWSRGKCSFKMLQYMAVGLPSIVSPVGMNRDVLEKAEVGFSAISHEQWYDALESLYNDWELQKRLGMSGRMAVEKYYNADLISKELAGIFRKTAQ